MKKAIANFIYYKLLGWKTSGQYPKHIKKGIIIPAPHTSNMDFLLGVLVRAVEGFQSNYIIKDSWIKKPIIGSFLKSIGGVGVNRSKNMKLTDKIVELFNNREAFVIAITPEGTRKYNPDWKSGFWYIAKEANVPLIPAGFDYATKTIYWGEPIYLSDDKEADIKALKKLFSQYEAKIPEWGIREE